MSSPGLHQGAAKYVLESFDAGTKPLEILNKLRIAGHQGMQLTTIEECLQKNGRKFTPHKPPNNTVRRQFAQRVALANTSQSNSNSLVKLAARRDWDAKADTLVMDAHRAGQTVSEIAKTLMQRSYTATVAIVVDSMRRQGGQNGVGVQKEVRVQKKVEVQKEVRVQKWLGVQNELGLPKEVTKFRWDAQADAFVAELGIQYR